MRLQLATGAAAPSDPRLDAAVPSTTAHKFKRVRLEVAPYDYAAAERLTDALAVSHITAQVLVRRGFADPQRARELLDANVRHPLDAFEGLQEGAERILRHTNQGSRITGNGDCDGEGVTVDVVMSRACRA